MRQNYSDSYWNDMLRREIEAGNPVWYSGFMADYSGHAFVLDGIDDNNYYHVNWGWGGVYDGFFTLDALILGEYEFDYGQYALLNFEPLRDGAVDNWLTLYSRADARSGCRRLRPLVYHHNTMAMLNVFAASLPIVSRRVTAYVSSTRRRAPMSGL